MIRAGKACAWVRVKNARSERPQRFCGRRRRGMAAVFVRRCSAHIYFEIDGVFSEEHLKFVKEWGGWIHSKALVCIKKDDFPTGISDAKQKRTPAGVSMDDFFDAAELIWCSGHSGNVNMDFFRESLGYLSQG